MKQIREDKRGRRNFGHALIQFTLRLTSTGLDSSSSEVSVFSERPHELGEMCKVR